AEALHDSVGAMLFRIGADVRDLRTGGVADPTLVARLTALEERVAEASAALREAVGTLRDVPEENELGLVLHRDCGAFQARTQIATRAILLGKVPGLPSGRACLLRRVVREALLNVEKHARASSVVVSLAVVDNGVTVVISDDGVGCSTDGSGGTGIGLRSVAQGVADAGGTFGVIANDDGGTTVRAWVPCL
ncbi:MAG: sensor histidine kinase, partial [Thermoplasmata archaeon]